MVVFDAGYDLTRLPWLLRDLPVEVLGRLRSDRVMYFPALPRKPGTNGRPARHGAAFRLADPRTWPAPAAATCTQIPRYRTTRAAAWGRLHQRLAAPRRLGRPRRRAAHRRGHPYPAGRPAPAR